MVSMVDWSRFGRGVGGEADGTMAGGIGGGNNPYSRYNKQRETEALKQAEEHGYFLTATRSFIEKAFAPDPAAEGKTRKSVLDDEQARDLSRVRLIHLSSSHLRTVGDIGLCVNLSICVLSNNFISRLDGLAMCENLLKLDVSRNQISHLPGPDFWAGLHKLRILHLHDNPIGRIETLTYLSSAPELCVLTLHDTPLSLKRNYRHHAVNSVWTLKALDHHVVADEEIIEDAQFDGHFAAYHPAFKINLCPQIQPGASFEDHLASIRRVIAAINKILAHHSPVLIAQKTMRGFLTRQRLKANTDTQLWAAVTIQRGFRDWKGIPVTIPPHQAGAGGAHVGPGGGGGGGGPPSMPPTSPIFGGSQNVDVIKMDYDTYLQNRRPGSTAHSEGSHTSRASKLSVRTVGGETKPRSSAGSGTSSSRRTNLMINLTKLQAGTLQTLQDDAVAIETVLPTEGTTSSIYCGGKDERRAEVALRHLRAATGGKKEPKPKRIKSVRQFFGPVVQTRPTPEPPATPGGGYGDDDQELPVVCFRLRGFRKSIQDMDPTTELILARREAGRDVRMAEFTHHVRVDNEPKPKIQRKSAEETSSLRRAINKNQTTMGLSCLRAVQQAYRDRERMEQQATRLEYVLGMKEQREAARDRVKSLADEKRATVLRERGADQKRMLEQIDRRDMTQFAYLEKNTEMRSKSSQHVHKRKGELSFIADFNVQNTSVSNALMRHDRQAVAEDKLAERTEVVMAHKVVEREQQDVVNKYLEHRQLMRQAEVAMSRAALDTKMLQEANDRLIEARTRVAQAKAKTANIQAGATVTFPSITTPSLPPVAKESRSALAPRPILSMAPRSTTVI